MKDVFSWIFRLKTSKLADIFGSPTKTSDLEILRYARQRFFGPNWQPWGFLQYFEKEWDLFWGVYLWGELANVKTYSTSKIECHNQGAGGPLGWMQEFVSECWTVSSFHRNEFFSEIDSAISEADAFKGPPKLLTPHSPPCFSRFLQDIQKSFFRKLPSGKLRQPWKISMFLGRYHIPWTWWDFTAIIYVCWSRRVSQKFSGKDVQDYMEFQSDTESQSRSSGKSGTRSAIWKADWRLVGHVFFVEGSFFFFGGWKIDPLVWEFYCHT